MQDIFVLIYSTILLHLKADPLTDRRERVWPWSCRCCPASHQWSWGWGCSCSYSYSHLYKSRMCSDGPAAGCHPETEQDCLVAHGHLDAEKGLNYHLFNNTCIITTKRLWLMNHKAESVALNNSNDNTVTIRIFHRNLSRTAHTYLKYEMMESTLTFYDKSRYNRINNSKHKPLPGRHFKTRFKK